MEDQDRIETEEEEVEGHRVPRLGPEREETEEPDVEGHNLKPDVKPNVKP